jgi:DNA-directed RNA polymerases I, II, and III subunit RPABC1
MDYETLNVLYQSRRTLLKILGARGYNTKPYEKFGPIEIGAMASASMGAGGAAAFRMDLERTDAVNGITKCRVEYSINRVKNRIAGFLSGITEEGNDAAIDTATTELVVILLEPVVEAFHTAAMSALATKSLRVSFFQAHTIVNNPTDHVLVPKHELLPSSEHAEFLEKHKIKSKANLPLIKFHEDMIARVMGLAPGDIVKITRPSPSAGEYVSYRICVP